MDKLRPVEEVAMKFRNGQQSLAMLLQADRDETVLLCVEVAVAAIAEYCKGTVSYKPIREAILAVAKPPEDPRERLGRAVRGEWVRWAVEQKSPKPSWVIPWEILSEEQQEVDCRIAQAVLAEQEKIEAEAKE